MSTSTVKALIAASPAAELTLTDLERSLLRQAARKVIAAREALVTELAAIRQELEDAEQRMAAGGAPYEGNFATRGGKADSLVVKLAALQEMFNEVAYTFAEASAG